jgi:hypothetical protein
MQKVTKNVFVKGRNTDADKNVLPPDTYLEAHNLELVSDGNFHALRNLKGTSGPVNIITGGNPVVIGAFDNLYKIGNTPNKRCITIITVSDPPTIVNTDLGQAEYNGFVPQAFEAIPGDRVLNSGLGEGNYNGFVPEAISIATITLQAIAKSPGATNPAARFHYRVNGGSWVYFAQTSVGSGSPSTVGTFNVPEGATVDLAVQNTSDQNIYFGVGNPPANWVEYFGKSTVYSFTATASSTQILGLEVVFDSPIYKYLTA